MRLVFWQNMVGILQAPALRALVERGHEVALVVDEIVSEHRRQMGWDSPDLGGVDLMTPGSRGEVERILRTSAMDTVHVVSGLRRYTCGPVALRLCVKEKRRVGFLWEGADHTGWRGTLRRLLYRVEGWRYGSSLDFVLAMGSNGVRWFRESGYPAARVFPYLYCTEAPSQGCPEEARSKDGAVEVLFVGQCVRRKGLDRVLAALSRARHLPWKLTVIGEGPEQAEWRSLVQKADLDARVRFMNAAANSIVGGAIAQADLLVLPSRFDGWGAVINEALMRGIPVLCSETCGGADLLAESWRGEVVANAPDAVSSWHHSLERWIQKGRLTPESMRRIRDWARRIEGRTVGAYFEAVMEHVYCGHERPDPPWLGDWDLSGKSDACKLQTIPDSRGKQ
jgi:glycosyltransferase involved in cell wall biosynthesis